MDGIGVLIRNLSCSHESGKALTASVGKEIRGVAVVDNQLKFNFDDGSKLIMYDDGQSCCETRYMVCDDDLSSYIGSTFVGACIKNAPPVKDGSGEDHDVQFLEIKTSSGSFIVSNHNEHNGYYGGFSIYCSTAESV